MIRAGDAPMQRAASTNWRLLDRQDHRAGDARRQRNLGDATATITVPSPGPSATDKSIARISVGNDVSTSIRRWLSRS